MPSEFLPELILKVNLRDLNLLLYFCGIKIAKVETKKSYEKNIHPYHPGFLPVFSIHATGSHKKRTSERHKRACSAA
jgi:hypothetical protein